MIKLLFFLTIVALNFLKAQESMHSSFGNIGNTQQWTYSIGQVFIHEVSGNTNSILPGIQQYFSFGTNQISENLKNDFLIYPNPTSSEIYIKGNIAELENVAILIKSLDGKILKQTDFTPEMSISLIEHPTGIYFIEISNNLKILHQQRIIKL